MNCGNSPRYADRQVWANSIDPVQMEKSDQGLHCLTFFWHLLDEVLYDKI